MVGEGAFPRIQVECKGWVPPQIDFPFWRAGVGPQAGGVSQDLAPPLAQALPESPAPHKATSSGRERD